MGEEIGKSLENYRRKELKEKEQGGDKKYQELGRAFIVNRVGLTFGG